MQRLSANSSEAAALARRLVRARELAGMSQQAAAYATGIQRTGISDIERGRRVVGAVELVYLARAYGSSVNRLLGIRPGARDGGE